MDEINEFEQIIKDMRDEKIKEKCMSIARLEII
jgi:hypothetical protein